ncbi:hypothetical protein ACKI1I_37195 [Streptomyces turgidiscabies]|uniref:Uncharacterized protein n=1 Tax=Streptomyces turgidiscabies (strain Car8) TaxID=698760 RepID=L7F6K6_STRT8|nr:hypothetical protein [Streptomyces turgidiscabies]ELP67203.1 hypothetical protein STRTUCAR8_09854 [Streptomyces turgidiscabies Car8]MDX3496445.1 hypothetical protein [Streptomyces turgidiscabies]GAQ76758.1 hypothetical protein T45_08562 [Streptomyces turgidiscabies]
MIILGLVILVAAVVIGVAGVVSNSGGAHDLTGGFSVFGVDVTGSTGTLFLCGIVVGAAGLLGLSLLLAGASRGSRRGGTGRHGVRRSRRATAVPENERDALIEDRDSARSPGERSARMEPEDEDPGGTAVRPRQKNHWFHHRAAH